MSASPSSVRDQKVLTGVVGFFDDPQPLIEATRKTRDARWQYFDAFTPYPVHGLEAAQGLKRSPLPWVTLIAGATGTCVAFMFQYWTSAVDWPLIVGGKPFNSWPAFVPIMFELTVLFGALATVGAMFALNGLPNVTRRIVDPSVSRDRFALVIEAPPSTDDPEEVEKLEKKRLKGNYRPFSEAEAMEFLKSVGAKDVRNVYAEGWF